MLLLSRNVAAPNPTAAARAAASRRLTSWRARRAGHRSSQLLRDARRVVETDPTKTAKWLKHENGSRTINTRLKFRGGPGTGHPGLDGPPAVQARVWGARTKHRSDGTQQARVAIVQRRTPGARGWPTPHARLTARRRQRAARAAAAARAPRPAAGPPRPPAPPPGGFRPRGAGGRSLRRPSSAL